MCDEFWIERFRAVIKIYSQKLLKIKNLKHGFCFVQKIIVSALMGTLYLGAESLQFIIKLSLRLHN